MWKYLEDQNCFRTLTDKWLSCLHAYEGHFGSSVTLAALHTHSAMSNLWQKLGLLWIKFAILSTHERFLSLQCFMNTGPGPFQCHYLIQKQNFLNINGNLGGALLASKANYLNYSIIWCLLPHYCTEKMTGPCSIAAAVLHLALQFCKTSFAGNPFLSTTITLFAYISYECLLIDCPEDLGPKLCPCEHS